ncbi:MAG: sulfatase-like hydrolase/transferase [Verrucomicrobia bacterium]|nr:sulfatase-like hydrolase/transferase [Verrucomicrobiota bacterium]
MTRFVRLLLLFSLLGYLQSNGAERRPNIILMMADDFGYEALACNGGTSYETPAFDRIASQGMRFTRAYSQPVCTPSRVKIMTGQSNARNYISFGVLREGEVTFGNVMKAAGYKTSITGKWQLSGNNSKGKKGMWWQDCGFDQSCMWAYAHYLQPKDLEHFIANSSLKKGKTTSRFWNASILENGKYRPTTKDDFGPDIYSDFVLDFIEENKDEEFFVYYPMALTHAPFVPTPHSKDFSIKDKFSSDKKYFGEMVRYTGYIIERIINKLEETGIAEDTLVIFTTDNGTGRGVVSWMGDRLVTGGKAFPVDAGTHVPMIAYWKGTIEPGTICNDLIEHSDFLPTLAEIGQSKLPSDRVIDGRSFLPQLKGERGNPRDAVVVHYDKDPDSDKPKFRRVRFAFDGTYKLYLDGRMIEVAKDYLEQSPITLEHASKKIRKARAHLQEVLDKQPEWEPDNSTFGGKPSKDFQKFLDLQESLDKGEKS